MSELFNEAFGKVFTKESLNDIPETKCVFSDKEGTGLCDISFDEGTVRKSLEKLRDDKAAGADELVPRFLNVIKHELAYEWMNEWMNENARILSAFENRLRAGFV